MDPPPSEASVFPPPTLCVNLNVLPSIFCYPEFRRPGTGPQTENSRKVLAGLLAQALANIGVLAGLLAQVLAGSFDPVVKKRKRAQCCGQAPRFFARTFASTPTSTSPGIPRFGGSAPGHRNLDSTIRLVKAHTLLEGPKGRM